MNKEQLPRRAFPKRSAVMLIGLSLVLAAVIAVFLYMGDHSNPTVRGTDADLEHKNLKLQIGGLSAPYNNHLTNILIIGTDQPEQNQDILASHRNNGQADFLLLVSVDHKEKSIKQLQIDRDTMADIVILSVLGEESGTRKAQICLAHAFGQTEAASAALTARAVSNLLFGVPINDIISLDMGRIAGLVDFFGGVPVKLDQNYPTIAANLLEGSTVKMDGQLAHRFVRARRDAEDGSNTSRMNRQRLFIHSLLAEIIKHIQTNPGKGDAFYNFVVQNMFTSMSKGSMINTVNKVLHYKVEPITTLDGDHQVNTNGFIEMHPNPQLLEKLAIDWFTAGL